MNTFEYIILGLQIGMQAMAAFYCLKIMLLRVTPTRPYLLLVIAFLMRSLILVNNKYIFFNPGMRYFFQISVSVLTMIAFAQIYLLIKKHVNA